MSSRIIYNGYRSFENGKNNDIFVSNLLLAKNGKGSPLDPRTWNYDQNGRNWVLT
ncbi:hypothetical protein NC653_027701 [Populus alba x Populus x berolinensis]|uniref:Uncharacterized protein n=1 Tax=Populus alba x Populus x berolinensis TaxID=444605 RepID=A0AAD6M6Z4_9ROSI|nr:hypothetical protein NC653_027701 [Populus alba x Populus x berolinensis]